MEDLEPTEPEEQSQYSFNHDLRVPANPIVSIECNLKNPKLQKKLFID